MLQCIIHAHGHNFTDLCVLQLYQNELKLTHNGKLLRTDHKQSYMKKSVIFAKRFVSVTCGKQQHCLFYMFNDNLIRLTSTDPSTKV